MSDWSKSIAPVVAWAMKIILGLLIAYGFWEYSPPEFKAWTFQMLDKYLPTIGGWFK